MGAVDLFTWRDQAEAAERVAEAERALAEARRAVRYAPHGQLKIRQARLAEAAAEALQAEVCLARIERQVRP